MIAAHLAGTETFVRNWENTVVRIVVRNSALREKDPIMGIVSLKLKDLFANSSEVTRLFSVRSFSMFSRTRMLKAMGCSSRKGLASGE